MSILDNGTIFWMQKCCGLSLAFWVRLFIDLRTHRNLPLINTITPSQLPPCLSTKQSSDYCLHFFLTAFREPSSRHPDLPTLLHYYSSLDINSLLFSVFYSLRNQRSWLWFFTNKLLSYLFPSVETKVSGLHFLNGSLALFLLEQLKQPFLPQKVHKPKSRSV